MGLSYWFLFAFWILACISLGYFIRTKTLPRHKVKIGLFAILVSYFFGVALLVFALVL